MMAKFSRKNRLFGKEKEKLLFAFCHALNSLKTPEEAAMFIQDLMSGPEAEMLAKRLKIAELLIEEHTFDKIEKLLKVSRSTIARVSAWLQESGEGYRRVLKRLPEYYEEVYDPEKFRKLKYRYPQYYWPQLLLEELITKAPKRQQQRLTKILGKMPQKTVLYRRLNELLLSANRISKVS